MVDRGDDVCFVRAADEASAGEPALRDLARHPDAKFIHDGDSVTRHAGLQKRMVAEALRVLRPGGRLVYAVCSINPAENERVVEHFPELQSCERLFPAEDHDGFFVACLSK